MVSWSKNSLCSKWLNLMSMFLLKINFVSTPEMWQSKLLLTIDECGSNVTRNRVFDCHLPPVRWVMAIENPVSNFFLVYVCHKYWHFRMPPIPCSLVVCFMMLQWTFYLELLVLERKVYNNEDIAFLSVY